MDFWNENQVYKWDILGDFQLVWKWLIGTFELKVETEVSILNLYVRNNMLTLEDLEIIENLGDKTIIMGDLNAKHDELLVHSQQKKTNTNGIILKKYLTGNDKGGIVEWGRMERKKNNLNKRSFMVTMAEVTLS